jgi:hypothetical protein
MKTEMFQCEVCGKTAKLESGKRHWCDCNPQAPFYMVSVRMRHLTDKILNKFFSGVKR